MFSPLRNRFGIPGVISVIALVFAMLGGAYAASSNSGGNKATASANGKQGPRGPRGKSGPAGPAGPAGAQGPAGSDGLSGLDGENGKAGKSGANGKAGVSVTNEAEPPGAHCTEGGTKLVGTSTTYACNGTQGEDGEDGETGFTETLPAGKTETGVWTFGVILKNEVPAAFPPFQEKLYVPISFTIPLAAGLPDEDVHFILQNGEETTGPGVQVPSTTCTGSPADPTAPAGHLCVYTAAEAAEKSYFSGFSNAAGSTGASKAGALIQILVAEELAQGRGTWAVTAPAP